MTKSIPQGGRNRPAGFCAPRGGTDIHVAKKKRLPGRDSREIRDQALASRRSGERPGRRGQSRLPGDGGPNGTIRRLPGNGAWAPMMRDPGSTGPAKTRQRPPARCARPPRDGRGPKAVSGRIWPRPVRFDPQNMARSKTGPAPPHQAEPGRCRCTGPTVGGTGKPCAAAWTGRSGRGLAAGAAVKN